MTQVQPESTYIPGPPPSNPPPPSTDPNPADTPPTDPTPANPPPSNPTPAYPPPTDSTPANPPPPPSNPTPAYPPPPPSNPTPAYPPPIYNPPPPSHHPPPPGYTGAYPPAGYPGAYAPPPQPQTTRIAALVVTRGPAPGAAAPGAIAPYREMPAYVVCQHCGQSVTTMTHYAIGVYTFVIALVLICVGLVLGCFLIPFFISSCKDVVHKCPNCQNSVGRFSRL